MCINVVSRGRGRGVPLWESILIFLKKHFSLIFHQNCAICFIICKPYCVGIQWALLNGITLGPRQIDNTNQIDKINQMTTLTDTLFGWLTETVLRYLWKLITLTESYHNHFLQRIFVQCFKNLFLKEWLLVNVSKTISTKSNFYLICHYSFYKEPMLLMECFQSHFYKHWI